MNQSESENESNKKHILLVEDSLTQATYMQHILEQSGFKVTLARSGENAMAAFSENKNFDLILTDINMPGINGYELVKEIRKSSNLPCLLLITVQFSEEVEQILASAADGLIFKSNDSEKFLAQLRLALTHLKITDASAVSKGQRERRLESFFALAYQQIIDLSL